MVIIKLTLVLFGPPIDFQGREFSLHLFLFDERKKTVYSTHGTKQKGSATGERFTMWASRASVVEEQTWRP